MRTQNKGPRQTDNEVGAFLIRENFWKTSFSKLENTNKTQEFFEGYHLSNLTQEETENLKNPMYIKGIELIILTFQTTHSILI